MLTSKSGFGFYRVAAVTPEVVLGDPLETAKRIVNLAREYEKRGAKLIVFPELCLTGYTAADLLYQTVLLKTALEGLEYIRGQSRGLDALLAVGLPLRINGALFNVAVLIDRGHIAGVVPKTYIPGSNEFYERRWIAGTDCLLEKEVKLFGKNVPIGTDILFVSKEDDTAVIAIELCEDLWVPIPPSSRAAIAGATIIVNLSASNELVGKAEYRRKLVEQQSGRCIGAYVYCSAGASESTIDTVFGGHCLIAENGAMLKESERFVQGPNGIIADLDTQVLALERSRTTSFAQSTREIANFRYRRIEVRLKESVPHRLKRPNPPSLFVPENEEKRNEVCGEVFDIQTAGLSRRLRVMKGATGRGASGNDPHVVLGISGGLDSTLAFLVCLEAYRKLDFDTSNIHLCSMPSGNTSQETKSNACLLGLAAKINGSEIPIHGVVKEILLAIRHDGTTQDVAYENAQARARTLILMEMANIFKPSIVIGTGDLSELALGWYTFSGDQMSHYNVNSGVPKTLAQALIGWYAKTRAEPELAQVLEAILATPISPELTSGDDGKILQITEDIIGPYALHDFFLPHLIRRGSSPKKILYLAKLAFEGVYSEAEIKKWLRVFLKRFFNSQFKRQVTIEGLRIGSVDLSTRSFWRMPSEATARQWLKDFEDD